MRAATADHPPRFAVTLTNAGDEALTLTCGFAPPFSVTTMREAAGDAECFCYPVSADARRHVRRVESSATNATTTPSRPRAKSTAAGASPGVSR